MNESTHRVVPIWAITAVMALLPPRPEAIDGATYVYQPPNPVDLLHKIRSVFDGLIAASGPAPFRTA